MFFRIKTFQYRKEFVAWQTLRSYSFHRHLRSCEDIRPTKLHQICNFCDGSFTYRGATMFKVVGCVWESLVCQISLLSQEKSTWFFAKQAKATLSDLYGIQRRILEEKWYLYPYFLSGLPLVVCSIPTRSKENI